MRFLLLFIIILLVSSCFTEPDCIIGTASSIQFRMRDTVTRAVKRVLFKPIKVSGANGTIVFTDSVSTFSLPVNPNATETSYVFDYKYSYLRDTVTRHRKDSITVTYAGKTVIVSTTCPPYIKFSSLDVPAHSFRRKPLVLNPELISGATVNIEIYF